MIHQIAGDRDLTEQTTARAIALTDQYGFPPYRAGAVLLSAWARGAKGAGNAELLEQEIARAAAAGPNVQYLLGIAGDLMLAAGRADRAMAFFERALAANEEPDVGFYLAEIWRLRGHALLALDRANTSEARRSFATAQAIARQQGASILERRAEASLREVATS
jgi:tetratricopeptide (TPR) repeat protein